MPLPDRVLSTDVRREKVCGESVRNVTHYGYVLCKAESYHCLNTGTIQAQTKDDSE